MENGDILSKQLFIKGKQSFGITIPRDDLAFLGFSAEDVSNALNGKGKLGVLIKAKKTDAGWINYLTIEKK